MPITIVVGGQFGSEGKGKVCAYLALHDSPSIMVRCGGPNSGHTVYIHGKKIVMKQLPVGAIMTHCRLLVPAGGCIRVEILKEEIRKYAIDSSRIGIDPNAVVIQDTHIANESYAKLGMRIGSTLSGTGGAVVARAGRSEGVSLAKDSDDLRDFLTDVADEVSRAHRSGKNVLIEGTQGFGLSIYHTQHYPYATSRDTTAAGFASEVGISPRDVDRIVMVIRSFPIRVGGNSGPLKHEITWQDVRNCASAPDEILEYTSVTQGLRRVGEFDPDIVKRAIMVNKPSDIILNHLDYVDWTVRGLRTSVNLSPRVLSYVSDIEEKIAQRITCVGTGPASDEVVLLNRLQQEKHLRGSYVCEEEQPNGERL
jgi:adenylosuccinate synthase